MNPQCRVLKRIVEVVMGAITVVAVAGFLVVAIMEWMAGCGETYVDANGVRHMNECLFLTVHNEGVSK